MTGFIRRLLFISLMACFFSSSEGWSIIMKWGIILGEMPTSISRFCSLKPAFSKIGSEEWNWFAMSTTLSWPMCLKVCIGFCGAAVVV